jgi:hypothetical protein
MIRPATPASLRIPLLNVLPRNPGVAAPGPMAVR